MHHAFTDYSALEEYEYEESMSYGNGAGGSNYHCKYRGI